MNILFCKYQGTGNDFILIDNRAGKIVLSKKQIAFLCDRRFGIGADGLMLLETAPDFDFKMVYYNADGSESTMCGNGGRCITLFAKKLGIIENSTTFIAIDGIHKAEVHKDGTVSLSMTDVTDIRHFSDYCLLDTGSPHYVRWVEDASILDVYNVGKKIRYAEDFQPKGINVNFVQRLEKSISVRTYERGVEDETLSCGTGVTASAIAYSGDAVGHFIIPVSTPGGKLEVQFQKHMPDAAENVILKGPATLVFEGQIQVD